MASIMKLNSAPPGMRTSSKDSPPLSSPSRFVISRPPSISSGSSPWQEKHLLDRIGLTSRAKSISPFGNSSPSAPMVNCQLVTIASKANVNLGIQSRSDFNTTFFIESRGCNILSGHLPIILLPRNLIISTQNPWDYRSKFVSLVTGSHDSAPQI